MLNTFRFGIFILGLLMAPFAIAGESNSKRNCDVLPKPENVVSVPEFSEGESCPEETPIEKLQYQSVNDDASIFQEKTSKTEVKDGAKYLDESELYVDPEPDHKLTREIIIEPTEVGSEPASDVQ